MIRTNNAIKLQPFTASRGRKSIRRSWTQSVQSQKKSRYHHRIRQIK